MNGDFAPLLNMVAGRGTMANMAETAPHWKAGHSHSLSACMGFWERTFAFRAHQKAKSQLVLSSPPIGDGGGMSMVSSRPANGG